MEERNLFQREIDLSEDESLVVRIDQISEGDTGVVVWDAAIVLAKYLQVEAARLRGRSVVELGSGTGAVGICAAALGASPVLLTDLPHLLDLPQHNIELNRAVLTGPTSCLALTWGHLPQGQAVLGARQAWDLVLLSDCVFYMDSVGPLVVSLEQLCGHDTELLVSYEERQSQEKVEVMAQFYLEMGRTFTWRAVAQERQHPEYRCDDIKIVSFRRNRIEEVES